MDTNLKFELHLPPITCLETGTQPEEIYEKHYTPYVMRMLDMDSQHYLMKEDLLERNAGRSMDEILLENPYIKFSRCWSNPNDETHIREIYLDINTELIIEKHHLYYDRFFAYNLKHRNLLRLDHFLEYQLVKHYDNKIEAFARFLHLVIREYQPAIITEKKALTVQEWAAAKLKEDGEDIATKNSLASRRRGRINRSSKDNITILTKDQTALLIHYLRENKVFLKDEYLKASDAGKAFELLTGYSDDTLRQALGKASDLENRENLNKLHLLFTQLTNHISGLQKVLPNHGTRKFLNPADDGIL